MLEKAEENKLIAEKCRAMGKYNAGASRAYYSAFQMAKHMLSKDKFSYKEFLDQYFKGKDQHEYSHGTISLALRLYLMKKKIKKDDLDELNVWDSLYYKRIKADYDEKTINSQDMDRSLMELNKVLAVLKSY